MTHLHTFILDRPVLSLGACNIPIVGMQTPEPVKAMADALVFELKDDEVKTVQAEDRQYQEG
jgi:aryl-alcohol dehydrogenase-like predicted oxidoreductase